MILVLLHSFVGVLLSVIWMEVILHNPSPVRSVGDIFKQRLDYKLGLLPLNGEVFSLLFVLSMTFCHLQFVVQIIWSLAVLFSEFVDNTMGLKSVIHLVRQTLSACLIFAGRIASFAKSLQQLLSLGQSVFYFRPSFFAIAKNTVEMQFYQPHRERLYQSITRFKITKNARAPVFIVSLKLFFPLQLSLSFFVSLVSGHHFLLKDLLRPV